MIAGPLLFRTQMPSEEELRAVLEKESTPVSDAKCDDVSKKVLRRYYTNVDRQGAGICLMVVTQLVRHFTAGGLRPRHHDHRQSTVLEQENAWKLCGALPALPLDVVRRIWDIPTKLESSPVTTDSEMPDAANGTGPPPIMRQRQMRRQRSELDSLARKRRVLLSVCKGQFAFLPSDNDEDKDKDKQLMASAPLSLSTP